MSPDDLFGGGRLVRAVGKEGGKEEGKGVGEGVWEGVGDGTGREREGKGRYQGGKWGRGGGSRLVDDHRHAHCAVGGNGAIEPEGVGAGDVYLEDFGLSSKHGQLFNLPRM